MCVRQQEGVMDGEDKVRDLCVCVCVCLGVSEEETEQQQRGKNKQGSSLGLKSHRV